MKYYQNGIDVTFYKENGLDLPMSPRFFPVIEVDENDSRRDSVRKNTNSKGLSGVKEQNGGLTWATRGGTPWLHVGFI